MFLQPPPISLYIHIPWCIKKCPYCDFNSHPKTGALPENEYIDALLADFKQHFPYLQGRPLKSIFFGGGTPSLFSGESLDRLLTEIDTLSPLPKEIEITLEANPGASEYARFQRYRQAGINRLSIGIQSFQDKALTQLGRIHSGEEAKQAICAAKTAGFTDFNLDLMFGLPDQTFNDALKDLETAIAFSPSHLSWYQLTLEPNTYFYRYPPPLPTEDTLWEMYQAGVKLLNNAQFQQYEVSAYAKTKAALHNLNYWTFGDYLGIGAGAHSKLTDLNSEHILRAQRVRSPKHYLDPNRDFIAKHHIVETEDLPFEYMLNALRLTEGTPLSDFTLRTGLSLDIIQTQLNKAFDQQWLEPKANWLQTTPQGHQFLNDLTLLFLPDHD